LKKENRTEVSESRTVMVTDPAAQTREPASDPAFEKFVTDATIKNSAGNPEIQALTTSNTANDEVASSPTIAITDDDSDTTTLAAVAGNII
jgi:hypothetical protein